MRVLPAAEWKVLRRIAADIAGRGRAGMVLRALEGKVFVEDSARSGLHFDERTFKIDRMVFGSQRCPYVMAHEFGHAYHCYYWPVLSALMSPVPHPTAEAVALLFEMELREVALCRYAGNPPKGLPGFVYLGTSTWQVRAKDLKAHRRDDPRPFDILEKMLQDAPKDFHTLVGRIVDG